MSGYPALAQLVAGYLNQDWPLDYDDVWHAVQAFSAQEPAALIAQARDQALELLEAEATEEGLRRVLVDELGSGYSPPGDDLAFRAWLQRVAEVLAERP